jgi:IclR family transcriptional regulator, KDG regulon repressor
MSSLETAVTILGCFSTDIRELGVTEVARRLNIPKSTVSRLMKTMASRALIEQDRKTRRYRVGLLPFRLGQLYQAHVDALDLMEAEVVDLVDQTGFTGYISVLGGSDIVILRVRQGRYPVRMVLEAGYRVPAFATAAGKVLLARQSDVELRELLPTALVYRHTDIRKPLAKLLLELAAVRQKLWAEAREETFPGIAAIAAGVGSADQQQPVALSLSFPVTAVSKKSYADIVGRVVAAAARVAARTDDPFWSSHPGRSRYASVRRSSMRAAAAE